MRYRVKIALQIRVNHPGIARFYMTVQPPQHIFAIQTLPKAKAFGFEFVLKN
jgi:hypothetical protein